jgi:ribonuclease HI
MDRQAERLEPTTNIVAEHLAIQLGIEPALEHGVTDLLVLNDSQSPVRPVLGVYQCKQPHLKPLLDRTRDLEARLDSMTIRWVPREETTRADRLCREVDGSPSRTRGPRART